MNHGVKAIILGGAFTDSLANKICNTTKKLLHVTIYIENGTKCLISDKSYHRLTQNGISIKVLQKINIVAISYNPVSVYGLGMSYEAFKHAMGDIDNIPIIDINKESFL